MRHVIRGHQQVFISFQLDADPLDLTLCDKFSFLLSYKVLVNQKKKYSPSQCSSVVPEGSIVPWEHLTRLYSICCWWLASFNSFQPRFSTTYNIWFDVIQGCLESALFPPAMLRQLTFKMRRFLFFQTHKTVMRCKSELGLMLNVAGSYVTVVIFVASRC